MIPVSFAILFLIVPIALSLPEVTSEGTRKACKSPVSHCCVGRCRTYDFIDIPTAYQQNPVHDLNNLLSTLHRFSRANGSCALGLIGDSLMSDTRTALMCQLHSLGYVNEQHGLCYSGRGPFQVRETTPTIECSPNAIRLQSNSSRLCPRIALYLEYHSNGQSVVVVGKESSSWPKDITVIFNWGVHCNDIQCMQHDLGKLSHVLRRGVGELRWNLLWVETAPQHFLHDSASQNGLFRGGDYFGGFRGCGLINESLKTEANYRNIVVQEYMDSGILPKLPIIKKFDYLFDLFHLHSLKKHDCTHYCYAPLIYGSIWAQIAALSQNITKLKL